MTIKLHGDSKKRTLKAFDLSENSNVSVSSDPELQNDFSIKFNLPT